MKLITTRTRIRGAAAAWKEQYCRGDEWSPSWRDQAPRNVTHERLSALDVETATAADVEAIIGNDSWTRLTCDECNREVGAVVELGEEPDYESDTARVCLGCLRSALALVEADLADVEPPGSSW